MSKLIGAKEEGQEREGGSGWEREGDRSIDRDKGDKKSEREAETCRCRDTDRQTDRDIDR